MRALFVILFGLVISCHGYNPYFGYHLHTGPSTTEHALDYQPVYIDERFSSDEKAVIKSALAEWNFALNGYRLYVVETESFAFEPSTIETVINTHQGLIVVKRNSDNLPSTIDDDVLAWVKGLGSPIVNIISDRIGSRNLKKIVMHEIGHTLGLEHNQVYHSLMSEYYQVQSPCIDKTTILALAAQRSYALWDWHKMNYCEVDQ